MKKFRIAAIALVFTLSAFIGCSSAANAKSNAPALPASASTVSTPIVETVPAFTEIKQNTITGTREFKIISTSDTRGKFLPYDYAMDAESNGGSLVQLSTALKSVRDENTLLIDLGDNIQGNSAELFISDDPDVHSPMADWVNYAGYDIWVPGNHEFNYGMKALKNYMNQIKCDIICANVYDEQGVRIGKPYVIKEVNGVKVAVIGVVTPNIARWDAANLKDCKVTNPMDEIGPIISEIYGDYDILVLAAHMGLESEYGAPGSGLAEILKAFPAIEVGLASHEHRLIEGMSISNALVTENSNEAQSFSTITVKYDFDKGEIASKTSKSTKTNSFESDKKLAEMFAKYDETAKKDACSVIGKLENGPLAPADEIPGIKTARIQSTALVDLINDVQMYYSGAQISAAALFKDNANLQTGDIMKKNLADVYLYANTLYKVEIKGWQLKRYMEWSAGYYNQLGPDDLTISFNPKMRGYLYDMFAGVDYEIDISQPAGKRIKNLVLSSTKQPIADDETYTLAVNNYRATSQVTAKGGAVFGKDEEVPVIVETDIRGEVGGIRELIGEYVKEKSVNGSFTAPPAKNNWKIIGIKWNRFNHDAVVREAREGRLSVVNSPDGRSINVKSITTEDLRSLYK